MLVIVVSDTHVPDFAPALPEALLERMRSADVILHAGDVTSSAVLDQLESLAPVHVALGNRDSPGVARWGARHEVHLDLDGVSVAMLHDSGRTKGREIRMRRRFPDARLVVFGHSHIPVDTNVNGMKLLNPGSPTWKRRQPAPTYAEVRIRRGRARTKIVLLHARARP